MGRRQTPAALKAARGNPGRRPIKDVPQQQEENAAASALPSVTAVAKVTDDAQLVYDLVAPQLRHMNFLRDSDELAFRRYCETMARYWRVTKELDDLGGETYECDTNAGGTMLRMRPQFLVQERLARRLDGLEDRFGLTPMSRQQYVLALQRQPSLPFPDQKPKDAKPADPKTSTPVPAPTRPPAIGGGRDHLN